MLKFSVMQAFSTRKCRSPSFVGGKNWRPRRRKSKRSSLSEIWSEMQSLDFIGCVKRKHTIGFSRHVLQFHWAILQMCWQATPEILHKKCRCSVGGTRSHGRLSYVGHHFYSLPFWSRVAGLAGQRNLLRPVTGVHRTALQGLLRL